jgi:hypothetical protein
MKKSRLLGAACACLLLLSPIAHSSTIIDFDNLADGTVVSIIDGVTFSSSVAPEYGFDLVVSNVFDTTSGQNYLGVGDGGSEAFFPGDTIDLTFATPINSLSISFVSTSNTSPNTYSITTSEGSVSNGITPDSTLPDTGEVFTLLLTSATPFSAAQLFGGNGGAHTYNIDDIAFTTVPLPPAFLLFASGLLFLFKNVRRRPA